MVRCRYRYRYRLSFIVIVFAIVIMNRYRCLYRPNQSIHAIHWFIHSIIRCTNGINRLAMPSIGLQIY